MNNCIPNEWKFALLTFYKKTKVIYQILITIEEFQFYHNLLNYLKRFYNVKFLISSILMIYFINHNMGFDLVSRVRQHCMNYGFLCIISYGFSYYTIKLISNYFYDRKQMVKYKGKFSNSSHVFLGVPQGSILGPLSY
jgi:hypothetical protein